MVTERDCIFWGKVLADRSRCLPLSAHCLDVGLVFRALCRLDGVERALRKAAGSPLTEEQLDRMAVLAMLHDIGKANLGFQRQVFDSRSGKVGHIRELAPLLDPDGLDHELHRSLLASLPSDFPSWFTDGESAYSYLLAVISHHGVPASFRGQKVGNYWLAREQWWRRQGQHDPMAAVAEIAGWARSAFPEAFETTVPPLPSEPRLHHRLAGLVMLADWLGSNENWFPIERVALSDRLRHDRESIPLLLRSVGLDVENLRPKLAEGLETFESRFDISNPWPMQAAVDALDPYDDSTQLVIVESETGSGKTEAALNWFFKIFAAGKADSLYFALPTRVAAREIYGRVNETVNRWFPDPKLRPVTVRAVPGYPAVDGVGIEKTTPEDDNRWQDDEGLRRRERQWAAERPKRFLAAAVAVGTIDQALLSAVQTAHAHLRSVCLDRSLLVVDEVHASDVYMSRILRALLAHHVGVGGRAMLLSATLGARARHAFAATVGVQHFLPSIKDAEAAPYPSFTLADGTPRPVARSGEKPKDVRFELLPLALDPSHVVSAIAEYLDAGARVLVIMNTVARANALLRAAETHSGVDPSWLFACRGVICPHHGRFAPADRTVLDEAVSQRLGKESSPGPLLLVGTQTLEQSLDIDADLLVSDLAAADVLLQRVGRLHRHSRTRPLGCETARCVVLVPERSLDLILDARGDVQSVYKKLGYGSVYEDVRTLELTRRVLAETPEVQLPRDNRRLVEAVTHPESLASLNGEVWARHGQNIEGVELARGVAAHQVTADFDRYFQNLEFNDAGQRVTTRLGVDSLQLPLNRSFRSPFGEEIRELVIPGHLKPGQTVERVDVEDEAGGVVSLSCGDRRFCYSRFGLEVEA